MKTELALNEMIIKQWMAIGYTMNKKKGSSNPFIKTDIRELVQSLRFQCLISDEEKKIVIDCHEKK